MKRFPLNASISNSLRERSSSGSVTRRRVNSHDGRADRSQPDPPPAAYADQRTQRAVDQVADDQLAHHGCLLSVASLTRTSSAPAGCSIWKRSAGISSFKLIFVT